MAHVLGCHCRDLWKIVDVTTAYCTMERFGEVSIVEYIDVTTVLFRDHCGRVASRKH